jgi:heme-degrading monooxygenase HmoA
MLVVIFRSIKNEMDSNYDETAQLLRKLAMEEFGCLDFQSATEGDEEITLSYWSDELSIQRWKQQADHLLAQQKGRQKWYQYYRVQIAKIERDYSFSLSDEA